jgi:hypothetical protein
MRSTSLLLALALASFTDAVAQQLPLQPGQRVRVTAPASQLDETSATVVAWGHDTIVVRRREDQLVRGRVVGDWVTSAVPISHITRLEVGQRRSNWKRGVIWGAALGGGMGVVLMSAADEESSWFGCSGAGCVASGVFGGALWGLAIGALIKTDTWEEVPIDRLQVAVLPTRGGLGIGVRIGF